MNKKLFESTNLEDNIIGMSLLKQKSIKEIEDFICENFRNLDFGGFENITLAAAISGNAMVSNKVIIFNKDDLYVFRDLNIIGICTKLCFYVGINDNIWI